MPPRKEPCRNFLNGSCRYGDRCKFLHVNQQQPKPNVFGFGNQSGTQFQRTNFQQQPNPFGFGVQNNSQSRGSNDAGFKQNQQKPFENKWVRSSANANTSSARQPDNQQGAPNHVCTDPESCKRQIIEDFKNEKPLWSLTCYGHQKNGPCDVIGDVSYEELRVAAYDDAKRGMNMQSIVEKERSLITSKLAEFDNLVRNSYSAPANPAFGSASQNPLSGVSQNVTTSAQSPPLTSSFSQLGAFLNTGLSATPNNTLQQSNPFQNFSQTPGTFGSNNVNTLQQSNPFQNFSQTPGSFGSQSGAQSFHSPFTSNSATFNNSIAGERNSSSMSTFPQLSGSGGQSFGNTGLIKQENANLDDSIWSKEWKIGEIPEEAPPEYIF